MRFVGILAIEREKESAEKPGFRGFLQFPATAGPVSGLKFRNATGLYPKKLPCLTILIRGRETAREAEKSCNYPTGWDCGGIACPLERGRARAADARAERVVTTVRDESTIDLFGLDASERSFGSPQTHCRLDGGAGQARSVRWNAIFFRPFFHQMHAANAGSGRALDGLNACSRVVSRTLLARAFP